MLTYVIISAINILGYSDICYNQDNYRIINFEVPESLSCDAAPLKTHLTLSEGPHRPSDRFLRLHFERCIAVSAYGGDPRDDFRGQEINIFMEELEMR